MLNNLRLHKKLVMHLAGFFCAIVGIILNVTQLYLMAAILFLIPIVSYGIGQLLLRGMECTRSIPPACHEDEQVLVSLTIRNTGWLPKFYVRGEDRLPRWLEKGEFVSPVVLFLPPGESSNISYKLTPALRGLYHIDAANITSTDPLGFAYYSLSVPVKSELIVYPSVLQLRRPVLEETSSLGWHGLEAGRARGGGHDFHGIRSYQYGDEVRRVHWPTTARTGKLAVVENAQGTTLNAVIALDLDQAAYAGTDEGPGSAIEVAVKIAATVCANILQNTQRVRLIAWEKDGLVDILADGSDMLTAVLTALAKVSARGTHSLSDLLADRMEHLSSGTTLVYISPSSENEALFGTAKQLEAQGVRVHGFGLVASTFQPARSRGPRRPAPLYPHEESSVFIGPGMVQPVRRWDDLAQTIEGLGSVRK